jgi:hypothetical protein
MIKVQGMRLTVVSLEDCRLQGIVSIVIVRESVFFFILHTSAAASGLIEGKESHKGHHEV